jgi:hypothetical protein
VKREKAGFSKSYKEILTRYWIFSIPCGTAYDFFLLFLFVNPDIYLYQIVYNQITSADQLTSAYFLKAAAGVLKGLSHEIFGPVFWAIRMYLGLNVNRLWFLNFNDAPLI